MSLAVAVSIRLSVPVCVSAMIVSGTVSVLAIGQIQSNRLPAVSSSAFDEQ